MIGLITLACSQASDPSPQVEGLDRTQTAALTPALAVQHEPQQAPLQLSLTIPAPNANGLAVDARGNIYIGYDTPDGYIEVYAPDGTPLRRWGNGTGSAPGQFDYITSLAVDAGGSVYVTDFNNVRLQKFDAAGQFLWETPTLQPIGPTGVAVDDQGNVYVLNHRTRSQYVEKLNTEGSRTLTWGDHGDAPGQFFARSNTGPDQIAVDSAGHVYATDPDNARLQKFDAQGHLLATFGSRGNGIGQFERGPAGVGVDQLGNVYVSEFTGVVHKFAPDGRSLARWTNTGATRLLAVDQQGDLYVRDRMNGVVKKYRQP